MHDPSHKNGLKYLQSGEADSFRTSGRSNSKKWELISINQSIAAGSPNPSASSDARNSPSCAIHKVSKEQSSNTC